VLEIRGILPPTVNHMYNTRAVKKRIIRTKTPVATNFINFLNAKARQYFKQPISLENDVILYYTLYCDKKGRMDLDNTFKAIQDSLEGVAFENDRQITEIHAKKVKFAGFNGFDLEVKIKPLENKK